MTQPGESQLKPCPFCGHEQEPFIIKREDTESDPEFYYYALCKRCTAAGPRCDTKQEAIEAWDRRRQGLGKQWGPEDRKEWRAWLNARSGKWLVIASGVQESWACIGRAEAEELAERFNEYESLLQSATGERDYTPEEALREAQRRWGLHGWVELVFIGDERKNLEVGEYEYDKSEPPARIWKQHWSGETFRAAFASADAAQKDEK